MDVTGDGRDDIIASAVGANSSTGDRTMYLLGNVAPLPGDYNGDGRVDVGDYQTWKEAYGTPVDEPGEGADGTGDGRVDGGDYVFWRNRLARLPQPEMQGNSVPEPTAGVLLAAVVAFTATGFVRIGGRWCLSVCRSACRADDATDY